MRVLVPVLVVAIIAMGCVLIAYIIKRSSEAGENRRERRRQELLISDIYLKCLDVLDVEPFAAVIADRIRKHYAKKEVK